MYFSPLRGQSSAGEVKFPGSSFLKPYHINTLFQEKTSAGLVQSLADLIPFDYLTNQRFNASQGYRRRECPLACDQCAGDLTGYFFCEISRMQIGYR